MPAIEERPPNETPAECYKRHAKTWNKCAECKEPVPSRLAFDKNGPWYCMDCYMSISRKPQGS